MKLSLIDAMQKLPLIAILRGLTPTEAPAIGGVLIEAGFRIIEVPLNSPHPLQSIEILASRYGGQAIIGAGTVLAPEDVTRIKKVGGELIVAPNFDEAVVMNAKGHGMYAVPGVVTPSESFNALGAGADALKLFPAELVSPRVLRAMRAVLPLKIPLIPVGGVNPDNLKEFWLAGAACFGIGSDLYRACRSPKEVKERALALVKGIQKLLDHRRFELK